jgi:hypothetical protein
MAACAIALDPLRIVMPFLYDMGSTPIHAFPEHAYSTPGDPPKAGCARILEALLEREPQRIVDGQMVVAPLRPSIRVFFFYRTNRDGPAFPPLDGHTPMSLFHAVVSGSVPLKMGRRGLSP